VSDLVEAILDDLNTPDVIMRVNMRVNEGFHYLSAGGKAGEFDFRYTVGEVRRTCELLGVLTMTPAEWAKWQPPGDSKIDAAEIDALIAQRNAARKARDFAEADRIRTE